ncbi:hypothetical protein [Nocardia sp. NPDC049707]|uniref:hypothetical protein n=1 Tax=Nocardia sp. NPDC049707 TaxID=3154735 RepID=UPI003416D446
MSYSPATIARTDQYAAEANMRLDRYLTLLRDDFARREKTGADVAEVAAILQATGVHPTLLGIFAAALVRLVNEEPK